MASLVQQSTTQLALKFFLVLSSDHISPATGLSPTVTIRKEGGSFGSPSGSVTEIANGWYQVAGNATDTNTLGDILLHASVATADNCDIVAAQVVAFNPQTANLGLSNVPVNVAQWNGTNVASPATAGIPDVNAKNINNVATTSVTTINANQGTTQPVNFTGTGASALVQTDMKDIAGSAVSTSSAQLGVNLVNIAGSAVSTSSAQLGVNAVNIAGAAAAIDGNNLLKVDLEDINGMSTAGVALAQSTQSICSGTASGGTVSTVTVAAIRNPVSLTDVGQLIGRTIIFLGNTSSTHLQAQASNITASTTGSTPTITFTAMTFAPANGDAFVIL